MQNLQSLPMFLMQQEYLATHVLVSRDGQEPHEEIHPIPHEHMDIMRKIWTQQYYTWQANLAFRGKTEALIISNKPRRPRKARAMSASN